MIKKDALIKSLGLLIFLYLMAGSVLPLEQNRSLPEKTGPDLKKKLLQWVPQNLASRHSKYMQGVIANLKKRGLPLSDTSRDALRALDFAEATFSDKREGICVVVYGDGSWDNNKLRVLRTEENGDKILDVMWDNPDSAAIVGYSPNVEIEDINHDNFPEILVEFDCSAHTNCLYVYRWNGRSGELLSPDGKGEYFASDEPAIEIKDIDSDNVEEILCYFRSYNPPESLVQGYRQIYKWDGKNYMFSRTDTLKR